MFILPFNDRLAMKLNGQVMSSRPGRIFSLSPGIPHQELHTDTPPRYIGMFISKRFFEKQYSRYSRKKPDAFHGVFFDPTEGFLSLLKRFMIEVDSRITGAEAVLDALGIEICHSLIRAILKSPAPKDRVADRIEVGRVIEYLHANLDEKITVDVLAGIAHLSASHFARVFREDMGKSPMEYVQDLRLQRAKKLLLAGDMSVTDIALECGFGSPSYLSSCFQKQFRMTPREYRKTTSDYYAEK